MTLKNWSGPQQELVNKYLSLIAGRARGTTPSGARLIRDFVLNHPEYKQDSVVTPPISYDLMKMIDSLEKSGPDSAKIRAKLLGSEKI
jgi:glutamate--cysteine ligase catalytic subunit